MMACGPEPADGKDGEELFPGTDSKLNCDGRLGAVTFVTGVFGFMAAARVVNDLVRAPQLL
jgi:tRNA A37 threonylcarbamoyladenosine dehydratase